MKDAPPSDILYGALKMHQPAEGEGPRVNVDTVLLAHFASPSMRPARVRAIELGCAHGAISLILAKRRRLYNVRAAAQAIDAIDINGELIGLARKNAALNGLANDVSFNVMDLRQHRTRFSSETYDAVIMNPPYDEPGTSRPSRRNAMATAMHGDRCTLADVAAAGKYLLRNGGKLFLVMRAKRLGELFHLLYEHNVKPKRIRAVHPLPGREASVVLIEAVRAAGDGMTVEPPLFIYDGSGAYTEQLLAAYRLEDPSCPS